MWELERCTTNGKHRTKWKGLQYTGMALVCGVFIVGWSVLGGTNKVAEEKEDEIEGGDGGYNKRR